MPKEKISYKEKQEIFHAMHEQYLAELEATLPARIHNAVRVYAETYNKEMKSFIDCGIVNELGEKFIADRETRLLAVTK